VKYINNSLKLNVPVILIKHHEYLQTKNKSDSNTVFVLQSL